MALSLCPSEAVTLCTELHHGDSLRRAFVTAARERPNRRERAAFVRPGSAARKARNSSGRLWRGEGTAFLEGFVIPCGVRNFRPTLQVRDSRALGSQTVVLRQPVVRDREDAVRDVRMAR